VRGNSENYCPRLVFERKASRIGGRLKILEIPPLRSENRKGTRPRFPLSGASGGEGFSESPPAAWTSLASSLPPQFNRLLSVAADPNNSSILWGAGEGSCLASNNIPFICGLVQSSDGGKTWQAISSVKGWFKNVVVDSRNGNIYAGGEDDALPRFWW